MASISRLLLLLGAIYIFCRDNDRGAFRPGDWASIGWMVVKLAALLVIGLVVLALSAVLSKIAWPR